MSQSVPRREWAAAIARQALNQCVTVTCAPPAPVPTTPTKAKSDTVRVIMCQSNSAAVPKAVDCFALSGGNR